MPAGAARGDGELEIRPWTAHEASVPEVFPPEASSPDFRLAGEEAWDWAFRRNPAGSRLFLARRAGRVVARFGALPVRVRAFGEPRVFAHLLGSHASPDEPHATRLATARAFYEAHLGPQKDLICYGWPEEPERSRFAGEIEHELVRCASLLVRDPGPGPRTLPPGVETPARFAPEVETLYVRCAGAWGASAVRDAAFLNWRFAEHPSYRYRVLVVPGEAVPRGLAVYRQGSELGPGLGMLVDWLVTPGDEEAGRLLVEAGCALARADGSAALVASVPEWSPWSLFLQDQRFRHHPTDSLLFVRSALPRLDMLWLRDQWWTTLADVLFL